MNFTGNKWQSVNNLMRSNNVISAPPSVSTQKPKSLKKKKKKKKPKKKTKKSKKNIIRFLIEQAKQKEYYAQKNTVLLEVEKVYLMKNLI